MNNLIRRIIAPFVIMGSLASCTLYFLPKKEAVKYLMDPNVSAIADKDFAECDYPVKAFKMPDSDFYLKFLGYSDKLDSDKKLGLFLLCDKNLDTPIINSFIAPYEREVALELNGYSVTLDSLSPASEPDPDDFRFVNPNVLAEVTLRDER